MGLNIVIFGASGATGQQLVKQALSYGYRVTAFVRNAAKIACTHEHLSVVTGNLTDAAMLEEVIKNQDAVFSALGASSPFKYDQTVTNGIRNIIETMVMHNTRRLIYLSFAGVKQSRSKAGFLVQHIAPKLLPAEINGHEIRERMITQSPLQWVIVRPPTLTNGKHTRQFRCGEEIHAKKFPVVISRADVADFMLRQLTDDSFLMKKPLIMH